MQIKVDKKTTILVIIFFALLCVILGATLGRDSKVVSSGMHDHSSMGMQNNSSASGYTGADVMFLQMMIPHHQQAIDISNIALKSSKDAELLALAKIIIKVQSTEIVQMQAWLKDSNTNSGMGHSMAGMEGMLDETELSTLSSATGKSFDALWLKGMIGHHDGAIQMTSMIGETTNSEIKSFGEKVLKDQSAQIAQMQAMLKRIG